jgi:hypothetical protein
LNATAEKAFQEHANSPRKSDEPDCGFARSACAPVLFVAGAFNRELAFDVVVLVPCRLKARCVDSESRFLAIKKFFVLAAFSPHRRSPKPDLHGSADG